MVRLLIAAVISTIVLSSFPLPTALGQILPAGERYSLVLPRDPFKWETELNDLGQRGWDAIMAQQPAVGGLILHFVIFTRTSGVKAVDYKVVVAEFPTGGDPSVLDTARGQLEIQANGYGRNGWTLLQALTGQHLGGRSYIALILKKPLY
jgi:hypothetical protein